MTLNASKKISTDTTRCQEDPILSENKRLKEELKKMRMLARRREIECSIQRARMDKLKINLDIAKLQLDNVNKQEEALKSEFAIMRSNIEDPEQMNLANAQEQMYHFEDKIPFMEGADSIQIDEAMRQTITLTTQRSPVVPEQNYIFKNKTPSMEGANSTTTDEAMHQSTLFTTQQIPTDQDQDDCLVHSKDQKHLFGEKRRNLFGLRTTATSIQETKYRSKFPELNKKKVKLKESHHGNEYDRNSALRSRNISEGPEWRHLSETIKKKYHLEDETPSMEGADSTPIDEAMRQYSNLNFGQNIPIHVLSS